MYVAYAAYDEDRVFAIYVVHVYYAVFVFRTTHVIYVTDGTYAT